MTHKKFKDCGDDRSDRKAGHMLVFYAFLALMVVTGLIAVAHWGGKVIPAIDLLHTPLNLTNPVKILANVGAIMLIVGLAILTNNRRSQDGAKTKSNYYDWYLLNVIWAVALTGVLSQLTRLAGIPQIAYVVYYLHLVTV